MVWQRLGYHSVLKVRCDGWVGCIGSAGHESEQAGLDLHDKDWLSFRHHWGLWQHTLLQGHPPSSDKLLPSIYTHHIVTFSCDLSKHSNRVGPQTAPYLHNCIHNKLVLWHRTPIHAIFRMYHHFRQSSLHSHKLQNHDASADVDTWETFVLVYCTSPALAWSRNCKEDIII